MSAKINRTRVDSTEVAQPNPRRWRALAVP